jgi:hypothetical protein
MSSEETSEARRQKQIAKEYAEYNAEPPFWRELVHRRQEIDLERERLRALDGEIPEKGYYSPIARFEKEMEGE